MDRNWPCDKTHVNKQTPSEVGTSLVSLTDSERTVPKEDKVQEVRLHLHPNCHEKLRLLATMKESGVESLFKGPACNIYWHKMEFKYMYLL